MSESELQHFEEAGVADTPTAESALRVNAISSLTKRENSGLPDSIILRTGVQTQNFALTDRGTGCVRVTLYNGSTPVTSYETSSVRNPERGWPWNNPTVRDGTSENVLPHGLVFDHVGFNFYNKDHGGEGWYKKIKQLAADAAIIVKSVQSP
jgi:hypothetical protein